MLEAVRLEQVDPGVRAPPSCAGICGTAGTPRSSPPRSRTGSAENANGQAGSVNSVISSVTKRNMPSRAAEPWRLPTSLQVSLGEPSRRAGQPGFDDHLFEQLE